MRPDLPPLQRLLPRRQTKTLLLPLLALRPGARVHVLDAFGAVVLESGATTSERDAGADGCRAMAEPPGWRGTLHVGDAVVGSLEVRCATGAEVSSHGDVRRFGEAVHGVLQQALTAASVRRELASETLERYREVNLAYRLSDMLAGGFDEAHLPQRVLDEALRVVPADVALVLLDDGDEGRIAAAHGLHGDDARTLAAVEHVRCRAPSDQPVIMHAGAEADPSAPHRAQLWAPLRAGEKTLGGLLLLRRASDHPFSAGDAKLMAALATQAATYLDNARMHQRALEQARLTRELQLAHEVQARLMPTDLPSERGWEVAAWWSAAREVAGDFYDAVRQPDHIAVTVGDVADKGMPAALFMALTRSVLRASAGDGRGPGDVLERANALLSADASDGMFVTLMLAQLHADGHVRYANGGHNPALVVRPDGAVNRLARTGILVGWDSEARYDESSVQLAPGDALVLYTDGVIEARSCDGGEYGEDRFERLAATLVGAGASATDVLAGLRADLEGFIGAAEAFDDATILVARYQPVAQASPADAASGS